MATKQTSNEQILDEYIRHQTYLLRYAGGLRNEVLPDLAATEKKLYDSVIEWVAKAEGNRTLTGASGREWQKDFESALNDIRMPAWNDISKKIAGEMKELAVVEAATGARIIESALPVVISMPLPPTAQLISIVNSQPFEGRTLKGWMEQTAKADVDRMLTYAKTGIVQGQTPTQVARGIIGSQAANYADGQARKAFIDTESVILTITNGIQNEAKQALYAANSDIIDRELYVNTLDVRTTIQCIGAGEANEYGLGKGIYPRGKGPIPPLHFRCRSLRVPFINAENLGNRGFDSSTEKQLLDEYAKKTGIDAPKTRDGLPRGHKTKFDEFARKRRRELVGQVPAMTSYGDWLKTQTPEFQNQVLGDTRADMFRRGNLSLDKFVARDGDILTLAELKAKGLNLPPPVPAVTTAPKFIGAPPPKKLGIETFDTSDYVSAGKSYKGLQNTYPSNRAFIADLDPGLIGLKTWPDLTKVSDADLASLASSIQMVVVNNVPDGAPKRYITNANKVLSKYDENALLPRSKFRKFKDADEVDRFYENKLKATAEQKGIIEGYTGTLFDKLNPYLRYGKISPSIGIGNIDEQVATLNNFLHNNRTTVPMRVYRGVRQNLIENLKVGDVFEDKGFMSSTGFEDMKTIDYFTKDSIGMYFEILVDKGMPGASIKPYSRYKSENEFLLKGGKLTVEGIEGRKIIVRYSE